MNGVGGVLLAAGKSRRMGTPKQLLPWPTQKSEYGSLGGNVACTVIAAAYDAIARHCDQMIVVLGHEAAAVSKALVPRQFMAVHSDPDAEMLESIKAGLRMAGAFADCRWVLLHPGDVPGVAVETVKQIMAHRDDRSPRAVMPEFHGRGGHPVLIPREFIAEIDSHRQAGGLRRFWETHPQDCLRMPVQDAGCVRDLDSPADYTSVVDQ